MTWMDASVYLDAADDARWDAMRTSRGGVVLPPSFGRNGHPRDLCACGASKEARSARCGRCAQQVKNGLRLGDPCPRCGRAKLKTSTQCWRCNDRDRNRAHRRSE